MDEDNYGTVFHHADDLATRPPARLTPRGLTMLEEIWRAQGCPVKPADEDDDEIDGVSPTALASHHGTDARRRSAAKIRSHLCDGGYLHVTVCSKLGESWGVIEYMALSMKAFEALTAAGIIS